MFRIPTAGAVSWSPHLTTKAELPDPSVTRDSLLACIFTRTMPSYFGSFLRENVRLRVNLRFRNVLFLAGRLNLIAILVINSNTRYAKV